MIRRGRPGPARQQQDTDPPQPAPELPSLAEQAHTEALVRAFGSENVLRQMKAWRDIVREMRTLDNTIRRAPHEQSDPRQRFGELRATEMAAREALGDQVAVDLGHRSGR